jgi:predicted metal-dependent hydrolase
MKGTLYILLIVVALLCIYLVSLPTKQEHFLISDLKEKLTIINNKFVDLDIREASSSYTEDKTIIYLCLRDENGRYYPINTLIYVALHEIAHLLNKEDYGHTPAFHKIFDKLLCDASAKGIYDPAKPHTSWYCGVDIRGITMPTCDVDNL